VSFRIDPPWLYAVGKRMPRLAPEPRRAGVARDRLMLGYRRGLPAREGRD